MYTVSQIVEAEMYFIQILSRYMYMYIPRMLSLTEPLSLAYTSYRFNIPVDYDGFSHA